MATIPVRRGIAALSIPQGLRHGVALPSAAVLLMAVLQFVQIFRRAINWDEFWHYSQIHELKAGTLSRPLQTLHTRLFGWVTDLPGTGVDHIVVIRLFMFSCEMVTTAAIVALASRFSNRSTAILCALAYIAFPYVFKHGYSFRFDPPAAALLMSTLTIFTYSRLKPAAMVLAGVLLGIAPMVTIKIVLYAPAFAGVLWLRWTEEKYSQDYLRRLAGVVAVSCAVFALLFLWHSQGQLGEPGVQSKTIVTKAAGAMFGVTAMPYWTFAISALVLAPITAVLIVAAPYLIARSGKPNAERIAMAGLLLPVTTLVFYHNTAPYYYAYMLPPVLVGCAAAMAWFANRFCQTVMIASLLVAGLAALLTDPPSAIDRQRALLRAADELFPRPVYYFDFCGFLGTFPKVNGFMTPVSIDIYRSGGMTPMHVTMGQKVVPLLMNNDPMFDRLFAGAEAPEFLPRDAEALRDNYVHFWGPFWLAGKVIHPSATARSEEFLVPGPYTVRDSSAIVDGKVYRPGDIVVLDRGVHLIRAAAGRDARLVWGKRIKEPSRPAPQEPFWTDF